MRISVSRSRVPEHGRRSSGTWTEVRPTWLRVPVPVGLVEIVAEEVADRSWTGAIVDRFVPYGDVYFRFVARERVPGLRPRRLLHSGDPFPVARPGLDDVAAQGAWLDVQVARHLDLVRHLAADGLEPAGRGEHWWSSRFTPPPGH